MSEDAAGRRRWMAVAVLAVAMAAAAGVYFLVRPHPVEQRVYRIGWEISEPYQIPGADGRPTGLAVETVKLAAARRGIALEWVYRQESSEAALRSRAVDLWPLMIITEERKRHVHLTEPYLNIGHALMVPAGSPLHKRSDLKPGIAIAFPDTPIEHRLLRLASERVDPRPYPNLAAVVDAVCSGAADAAFMDEYAAFSILLKGNSCSGAPTRLVMLPEVHVRLAVGATFEAAPAADALREEISHAMRDGELAPVLAEWSYFTAGEMQQIGELVDAKRRFRLLVGGTVILGGLLAFAVWAAVRYRQQNSRARQAEMALRQSAADLRRVADSLSEMVMAFDMEHRLIFANAAVEAITGYTTDELRRAGFICWIHPDDQVRMLQIWDRLFAGVQIREVPYRLITKHGAERWMLASWGPILDDAGRQVGVHGSELDVTTLMEAQAGQRRLAEAVHQAAEAVFITAPDGTIEYVNPAFERTTGFSKEEALGCKPSILKSGSHDTAFYQKLWETIGRGEVWSGRIINRRRDGEPFTGDATISPVKNSRGEVERYVVVYKDITHELELEASIRRAQTMESIGRLAGGIAHDFNNLLTVINGNAEVALSRLPEDGAASVRLREILKAGERAAEMTGQLLALGRRRQTAPEVLVLNAIVRDLRSVLERLAGERVRVDWELDPSEGRVRMDPVEVRQVLINLVANARDAMPEGGRAVVRTRRVVVTDGHSLEFPDAPLGSYILLAVADGGVGMDAATRERIFEPFFSTKKPGKGTGLGLATVYSIVEQNHGWIGVRSEPDKGSVFTLLLPEAAKTEGTPSGNGAEGLRDEPARTTVLLVEDQEQVRIYVQKVLESNGYAVTGVGSGTAALEVLQAQPRAAHLLLTDVMMPEMSGTELARRVMGLYPETKVLCMSGYAGDGAGMKAWLAEGYPLLRKPFTAETLLARVRETLG